MKVKYFEYIVIYLSVFLGCAFIGIIGRLVLIEKGADEYTANVFFWICIGLGILMFAILSLFLHEFVSRTLNFFNKNKVIKKLEVQNTSEDYEKIREERQAIISDTHQAKIETAIHYTKQQFVLYTSDDDLKLLCDYIVIYSKNQDFENVKSIKVNSLSSLDIYHFGWNIWNHFKVTKQERIALFLKIIFAEILSGVEVESIKSHLKDDEQKGIIKIADSLSDFN